MKLKYILTGFLLGLSISSCIQDEALNVEAAIDSCTGTNIQSTTIDHLRKEIEVYVLDGTDISQQELIFTLPEGAFIQTEEAETTTSLPCMISAKNITNIYCNFRRWSNPNQVPHSSKQADFTHKLFF